MNIEYLKVTKQLLEAQQSQVELDLENLLTNTVAVGDHTNISKDISKFVDQIDIFRSKTETVNYLLELWGE